MQNLLLYSLVYAFQWNLSSCSTKCNYSSNCDLFIIAILHYLRHLKLETGISFLKGRVLKAFGSPFKYTFGLFHPILAQHLVCYFHDPTSIPLQRQTHKNKRTNKQTNKHIIGSDRTISVSYHLEAREQETFKNKMSYLPFLLKEEISQQSHTSFGVGSDERSYPLPPPSRVDFIYYLAKCFLSKFTVPCSMSQTIKILNLAFQAHRFIVCLPQLVARSRGKVKLEYMVSLYSDIVFQITSFQ